jgi:Mn-dependent DtxR family transcriptional regulator
MEKRILKVMKDAGKPVRPGDIAKSLKVDSKEVSKTIKALKEKGEIISPKRCFYSLP